MVKEAEVARALGYCDGSAVERLRDCLAVYELPVTLPDAMAAGGVETLLQYMAVDKKNSAVRDASQTTAAAASPASVAGAGAGAGAKAKALAAGQAASRAGVSTDDDASASASTATCGRGCGIVSDEVGDALWAAFVSTAVAEEVVEACRWCWGTAN